jgi:hypothetical protein
MIGHSHISTDIVTVPGVLNLFFRIVYAIKNAIQVLVH